MAETIELSEIKSMQKLQKRNESIQKHKSVYVSGLNQFLDQIYNILDAESLAKQQDKESNLSEEELQGISSAAKRIELYRKKIHDNAPLSDEESIEVILIMKHISATLGKRAENLVKATSVLEDIIAEFLKF